MGLAPPFGAAPEGYEKELPEPAACRLGEKWLIEGNLDSAFDFYGVHVQGLAQQVFDDEVVVDAVGMLKIRD
ncbi:MAG TPA: hypothetical protein DCM54_17180 [Gammaproteobacteria bacterium]|nr:hypothetical protein [Gammaproteobacteria bacterium]